MQKNQVKEPLAESKRRQAQIPINHIGPDPNQPRKTIDHDAFQELKDSILIHGVMQPIAVREIEHIKGKYMIIYGERRYRAAKEIMDEYPDRNVINAEIWEVSDTEALEMQLAENLLREDVHPMEEAAAFLRLNDTKTVEEISAMIGKTGKFIRDRIRLNNLLGKWQKLFLENRVVLRSALQLAALPEKAQEEIYKDKKWAIEQGRDVTIEDYTVGKYLGDLTEATWDLNREFTGKQFCGKCNGCLYNSASAKLFELENEQKVCSNISCYSAKAKQVFKESVKEAKNDPAVAFVVAGYHDKESVKQLQEELGVDKILMSGQYAIVEPPDPVDEDDLQREGEAAGMKKKDIQAEINERKTEYEKELKEFNEAVESGKTIKALVVDGPRAGSFIQLSMHKKEGKANKETVKEKISEGVITAEDIETEIARINNKEKRSKEIDINKIHSATVLEADKKRKEIIGAKEHQLDKVLLLSMLFELANYSAKEEIEKTVKWPKRAYSGYDPGYFSGLMKLSAKQISQFIRIIIFHHFRREKTEVSTPDTMLRIIAEYGGVDIKAIEKAQHEESEKRQERARKRIAELRAEKKKLPEPKKKSKGGEKAKK